jgi:hypothetical protein
VGERRGGQTTRLGACLVVLLSAAISVFTVSGTAWAATKWVTHIASTSSANAHANSLPAAPSGPSAACAAPTTAKTVKVSWGAVTHATSYSVYEATTSAGGTYTLAASGIATTSWTSGSLTASTNYWFEVVALIGTN